MDSSRISKNPSSLVTGNATPTGMADPPSGARRRALQMHKIPITNDSAFRTNALLTDDPGAGAECHPGKEREGFRSAKRGHAPHGPGGGENYSPKVDLIKRSFTLATCSRARRSANSALRLRIASKIAQLRALL